jgi:hypothetical protein
MCTSVVIWKQSEEVYRVYVFNFTAQQPRHFKQLVPWKLLAVRGLHRSPHSPSTETTPNVHGPVTTQRNITLILVSRKARIDYQI